MPQEHIQAVKATVKPLVVDLIDLQMLVGARPGEIVRLTVGELDMKTEVWRARLGSHKTEHFGKKRTLYFGPKSQAILGKYVIADPSARLFRISVRAYRDAIKRACEKLRIPRWTPHWLRHNAGTTIREEFGVEASQAILGHSNLQTTELYSQKSVDLANRVMKQIG